VSPTATILLKVITPRRILCEADAEEVSLPGLDGQIGMVVALGEGTLTFREGGESESHEVRGGYAEVRGDRVLVFTSV
jgi:F-type H+-transporting ATPase subunit epsilon